VSIIAVFDSKGTSIYSNGIPPKNSSWFLTFEQLTSLLSAELNLGVRQLPLRHWGHKEATPSIVASFM